MYKMQWIQEESTVPIFTHSLCVAGDEAWPPGCHLKFLSGDQFGQNDNIPVEALEPGSYTDISVEMTSPAGTGIHQGQWRMSTAGGIYFGGMFGQIVDLFVNLLIYLLNCWFIC